MATEVTPPSIAVMAKPNTELNLQTTTKPTITQWLIVHFWSKEALTSFAHSFIAGFLMDAAPHVQLLLSGEFSRAVFLGLFFGIVRALGKSIWSIILLSAK